MLEETSDKIAASIVALILIAIAFFASYSIQTASRIENTCKPTDLYTLDATRIYDCSGVGMEDFQ